MKRRLEWLAILGCASVFVSGCYPYRSVEFSPVPRPASFENWKIDVWVQATTANPASTNREYRVGANAWTIKGDAFHGKSNEFRATAYNVTIQALRFSWIEGTNTIELALPDIPNSAWRSSSSNWVRVASEKADIPPYVNELRAVLEIRFRHRETGQTEVKTITVKMIKGKRTKFAPVSV